MRIIRPITITEDMIVSCSVPENDYPAWSAVTAFSTGDRCILAHKIYEASADNTNKSPDTNPDQWIEVSATNRWKAFDKKVLDQTVNASSIQYVLTTGKIFDSLSLVNVSASHLDIVVSGADDGWENLLTYSEEFSNATAWPLLNSTSYEVTPNAILAPDGISTADLITTITGTSSPLKSFTATESEFCFAVHAKSKELDAPRFIARNFTTSVDLISLTIDINVTEAVEFSNENGSVTAVYDGDGWYKITIAIVSGITTGDTVGIYMGARGPVTPGTSWYLWRAQLNNGSKLHPYLKTTDQQRQGIAYESTESLILVDQIFDLYTFFFEETETRRNIVKLDLPPYLDATITITLTGSGDVGCGEIVLGKQANLGFTEWNPSIGTESYSSKGTDTFGNFIVVKRAYSATMSCSVFLEPSRFDFVKRRLDQFRDDPVVWVGSVDPVTGENMFESMMIYGFLKSFAMVIPGPQESGYNIEIIGLT